MINILPGSHESTRYHFLYFFETLLRKELRTRITDACKYTELAFERPNIPQDGPISHN